MDNYQNKGSQFESEMLLQGNPWTIVLGADPKHQIMRLLQNGGKNEIRLPSPEVMRTIAGFLIDRADKWERGELPGLKPPEKGKTP